VLVQWVLLYPHTNLYHHAFDALVKSALRSNHEPTLSLLLKSSKLVSSFVHHYEHSVPLKPSPPARGAWSDSEDDEQGSAAQQLEAAERKRERQRLALAARAAASRSCSAARGTILRTLNAVRLAAAALPPSALLCGHLRDHTLWHDFLPQLRADTAVQLRPLVPLPGRAGGQRGGAGAGGGSGGAASSSLSALQSLLQTPSAFNLLLGSAGSGSGGSGSSFQQLLRGGAAGRKQAAAAAAQAAAAAAAAAAAKAAEPDAEWGLDSSFAKELGMGGLTAWVDVEAAAKREAAAAAAAAATAAAAAAAAAALTASSSSSSHSSPSSSFPGAPGAKSGYRVRGDSKGSSSSSSSSGGGSGSGGKGKSTAGHGSSSAAAAASSSSSSSNPSSLLDELLELDSGDSSGGSKVPVKLAGAAKTGPAPGSASVVVSSSDLLEID
jgi:hypothetical protein